MPLGMKVGLSPGDSVLDDDSAPLHTKRMEPLPNFSAHFYCGQTAGCIKTPLGMEEAFTQGLCVRWGPSPPPFQKGGGARGRSPQFSAHVLSFL